MQVFLFTSPFQSAFCAEMCYIFSAWEIYKYVYVILCVTVRYKTTSERKPHFLSAMPFGPCNKVFLYQGYNNVSNEGNANNNVFFHSAPIITKTSQPECMAQVIHEQTA